MNPEKKEAQRGGSWSLMGCMSIPVASNAAYIASTHLVSISGQHLGDDLGSVALVEGVEGGGRHGGVRHMVYKFHFKGEGGRAAPCGRERVATTHEKTIE